MNQRALLDPLLWAAAIIAAAIAHAPDFLTLILLPCLAAMSLAARRRAECRRQA